MAVEESYPKLISLAVHELRSPAGVVGGYLRMLQRDTETPLSDRQRKMVEEAEKSCQRLVALIAALSDISKIDGGEVTMSVKKTDLFPLVADVAKSVHEPAEREVRLEVRGHTAGAVLAGDEHRLRAAFEAVFHAILREKTGPCTVVADCRLVEAVGAPTSAVVVITDEPSVQTAYDAPAGAFDEKRGGVGLSLALARRVIEAHGGRIWSPAVAGPGVPHPSVFDERSARSTALVALPVGEFRH